MRGRVQAGSFAREESMPFAALAQTVGRERAGNFFRKREKSVDKPVRLCYNRLRGSITVPL